MTPCIPMRILLAVAAGGFVGGAARHAVTLAAPSAAPWTTLWVNVLGSFLLALMLALSLSFRRPNRYLWPFAATGVLGSFTTFSTWMVEVERLAAGHGLLSAAAHLLGSLAAGLGAAALGLAVGRIAGKRASGS